MIAGIGGTRKVLTKEDKIEEVNRIAITQIGIFREIERYLDAFITSLENKQQSGVSRIGQFGVFTACNDHGKNFDQDCNKIFNLLDELRKKRDIVDEILKTNLNNDEDKKQTITKMKEFLTNRGGWGRPHVELLEKNSSGNFANLGESIKKIFGLGKINLSTFERKKEEILSLLKIGEREEDFSNIEKELNKKLQENPIFKKGYEDALKQSPMYKQGYKQAQRDISFEENTVEEEQQYEENPGRMPTIDYLQKRIESLAKELELNENVITDAVTEIGRDKLGYKMMGAEFSDNAKEQIKELLEKKKKIKDRVAKDKKNYQILLNDLRGVKNGIEIKEIFTENKDEFSFILDLLDLKFISDQENRKKLLIKLIKDGNLTKFYDFLKLFENNISDFGYEIKSTFDKNKYKHFFEAYNKNPEHFINKGNEILKRLSKGEEIRYNTFMIRYLSFKYEELIDGQIGYLKGIKVVIETKMKKGFGYGRCKESSSNLDSNCNNAYNLKNEIEKKSQELSELKNTANSALKYLNSLETKLKLRPTGEIDPKSLLLNYNLSELKESNEGLSLLNLLNISLDDNINSKLKEFNIEGSEAGTPVSWKLKEIPVEEEQQYEQYPVNEDQLEEEPVQEETYSLQYQPVQQPMYVQQPVQQPIYIQK